MSIESAIACINLVGKTVRPAHGTERWAFANGKPEIGHVIDVHIPDLDHPFAVVEFESETAYLAAFELDVVTH
jgi:hypothetical protein